MRRASSPRSACAQTAHRRLPDAPPAPPRDRLLRLRLRRRGRAARAHPPHRARPRRPPSGPTSPSWSGCSSPALVLLNDDDLAYAKIRLDADSLRRRDRRSRPHRGPARARAGLGFGLGRDPRRRDRRERLRPAGARQHRHRDRVDDDPPLADASWCRPPGSTSPPPCAPRRSREVGDRCGSWRRMPRPAPTRSSSS